jgi:hypothetical protein
LEYESKPAPQLLPLHWPWSMISSAQLDVQPLRYPTPATGSVKGVADAVRGGAPAVEGDGEGGVVAVGGGGDGDGGGLASGGGGDGDGGEAWERAPQSMQSYPYEQTEYSEPEPPSSQSPSEA